MNEMVKLVFYVYDYGIQLYGDIIEILMQTIDLCEIDQSKCWYILSSMKFWELLWYQTS